MLLQLLHQSASCGCCTGKSLILICAAGLAGWIAGFWMKVIVRIGSETVQRYACMAKTGHVVPPVRPTEIVVPLPAWSVLD